MQHRMKLHPLTEEQIAALLDRASVASLSTLNENGFPYTTPVHFAAWEGKLYVHGLPAGQKLDNLRRDSRVCLEAHDMQGLLMPDTPKPCDVNTAYESVIVLGHAAVVDDLSKKRNALRAIVQKYTPDWADVPLPDGMVKGTAVLEITPLETTGKYFK